LDYQQICEGYPKFYERALETMNQAKKEGRMQPLFIRPSTQWYVFEERLQGDGSGTINAPIASSMFGGSKRRSATSSVTQATKDEFGVYHVCYSMHSSQIELKGALKLLNPVEVISTTPHCGICDFAKASQPPTNPVTIVEAVEHCVLEDREFKKGMKNYSCSPSKVTNSSDVRSPGKLIPLFGHAQYVLPPSPPLAFPSHVSMSSPPSSVALSSPVPSDNLASTSQVSSQGLTSSQNARARSLFVEPELEVETSSKSLPLSLCKRKHCMSEPMSSEINEPNMPTAIALPSPYHRSVSLPVAPQEDIHSHTVRSKSLSRLPTRRKFRIPDPLPSLLDMKRSAE